MTPSTPENYPLNQLYFYLSEGCNLRCRHCWIAPKFQANDPGKTLPVELFKHIVNQAKTLGLTGVKLTGGEPLLHPDIKIILQYIQAEGLDLTVETNGVLCTADLARQMAACRNPSVSVSLDGADPKTHEFVRKVNGCFAGAVAGIKHLVEAGIEPQIIMSVMRCNRDQMEEIVELAESIGAGSVKFNIIQPTARGAQLHESGETLTIEELIELGAWVEKTVAPAASIPVYYDHPDAFRPMSRMYGKDGDGRASCGIFGILGVLADGAYALCGIGASRSELVFGHAEHDELATVWNDTAILQQIREGLPGRLQGICQECLLKTGCLGSCLAQNFYRSDSLWASYWYCEQAASAGLFPETRRLSTYRSESESRRPPILKGE